MNNAVKLKTDIRDRHAHIRFGQTATFTPESNFGFDLYSVVEPETAVSCTAFSTTKIRSSQTKVQYDIDDLWKNVIHNQTGADPRDVLSLTIKNGLKDLNDVNRDFGIKGYYRGDTGSLSISDNVRSAMTLNKSSVMVNSYWYFEWSMTPIFGKMPIGKTKTSTHSYIIVDWKIIDGETVFLIDSHQGQKRYMPFNVLEEALKELGTSVLMPSTEEVLEKRNKVWYEAISDIIKNLWIAVTQLGISIKQLPKPIPVVPEPKSDYQEVKEAIQPMQNKITQWAKAIAKWEGDTSGTNPGNLKFAPLTQKFGAIKGRKGADGGYFCKFPTYEIGFDALCKFLEMGCKNQLLSYHSARTFEAFTKIYAGSPPHGYIEGIRQIVGCELNTDISTFLT